MSKIKNVADYDPEVKIVLYGKPGTGKTTLASSFPNALLIDISEKGSDSVRDVKGLKVIRVSDWDDLEDTFWYLKSGEHDFDSVIIDTMSYAQTLAMKKVLEDKGKEVDDGKLGGWGTMARKDWGTVSSMLNPFISNMRDLPMNVCFIAHDTVFNAPNEEEADSTDKIEPSVGPRLMPSVASTLNAAVGLIGHTFIRERFITEEIKVKGATRKKERRVVEYCLRVGPHSYYITKVRKPKSIDNPEILVDAEYQDILDLISGKE